METLNTSALRESTGRYYPLRELKLISRYLAFWDQWTDEEYAEFEQSYPRLLPHYLSVIEHRDTGHNAIVSALINANATRNFYN